MPKNPRPRKAKPETLVLSRAWWNDLPIEIVADLRLIAFADTDRGVLMLRPDTHGALDALARREYSSVVESATHEVLRQAIRLVMPPLSKEGWRTDPVARTLELLFADTSAVFHGQKCGVTTWGEARNWQPCSPFREAVEIYDGLAHEVLGHYMPIDQIIMDFSTWLVRWYQPRPGPRLALSGAEFVAQAVKEWQIVDDEKERAGRWVLLQAFVDGQRPGCPIGQGPTAALQPILDALGPEPDLGHIASAYRRLLEHPATTDLEIEIFLRCLELNTATWQVIDGFDAAYGRMPTALHYSQPPPPPHGSPQQRARFGWLRHGISSMEVEMEITYGGRLDAAEQGLHQGRLQEVLAECTDVARHTPNVYPPSIRQAGQLIVRFWDPAELELRIEAGEFTRDELESAIPIRAVWPRAHFLLACALAQADRLDEAEQSLDAGERLDGNVHFALERAAICGMRGDRARAMAIFQAILARPEPLLPPHRCLAERSLAVHLIDLGHHREAFEALARAEEALPGHPGTRREIAFLITKIVSGGNFFAPMARTFNNAVPRCAVCGASAMGDGSAVFIEREGLYLCGPCRVSWAGASED